MACLAVADIPTGSEWEYELKFDGYRAISFKVAPSHPADVAQREGFLSAALVRALEPLANETVIDGEIVALDATGRPSFNLLQNDATREYCLVFYVFDLLILAGKDLRNEPLEVRRKVLHTRVMSRLAEPIRFSETIRASAAELIRAVRRARPGGRDRETPQQLPSALSIGSGLRPICTPSCEAQSPVPVKAAPVANS